MPTRWKGVTALVVSHIEDLLLVGDFGGAIQLTSMLANETTGEGDRKPAATAALVRLGDGVMMTHVVTHLRSVDDTAAEQLQKVCHLVGPSIVKGLAEALANEKRAVARQRFTQILLGFGAAGKTAVEQLRASANPAVRRTAIHLLREFGGSEALPDLTTLLDDREPHVQREAVRAILSIGTEEAYAELQKALASGTDQTREALISALVTMRSERAIPLFEYIVRKIDRTGPLRSVYLQAVESLGALKAEHTVDILREALYSGQWWAPFRTAELRRAVATALRQIGTTEAQRVLQDASTRDHAACAPRYGRCRHETPSERRGTRPVIDAATRAHLSDDLIRRFGASLRGIQLYSPSHPIVARNLEGLAEALRALHAHDASVVIGMVGGELIVGELPMTKASASMGELIRRFGAMGIERITIERHVTLDELKAFADKFGQLEKTLSGTALKEAAAQLESPTIRVGRSRSKSGFPRKRPMRRPSGACTPTLCRWPAWYGKPRARTQSPTPPRRNP